MDIKIRVYKNEDIEEIVMAIPRNHYHVRALIKFNDQAIVLQEAALAAITRAYLSILLHPTRKGIILTRKYIRTHKPGYAPVQLIEEERLEEKAVDIITEVLEANK
ncbi:MAG: hypothetical protein ABWW65_07670 [Thermoprotei archaeon]